MRFLCLPGAYGSADVSQYPIMFQPHPIQAGDGLKGSYCISDTTLSELRISSQQCFRYKFRVQLMPILQDLVSDNSATFHFIQGPHEAVPPEGYEEYFGGKPYYRFVEYVEATGGVDVLKKIRDFPEGATAEDMLRELLTDGADGRDSLRDAINLLYRIMDEEGPFEGILGYSEGASIAATLLLTEQRRFQQEGVPPMLKCGVFFAGWPPMTPELDAMVLADESELLIDVPTCHIVGSLDPYLPGSVALYNVCDPDTAYLFDHGKGHTLPRDRKTVKELGDVIRNMIASVSDIAQ